MTFTVQTIIIVFDIHFGSDDSTAGWPIPTSRAETQAAKQSVSSRCTVNICSATTLPSNGQIPLHGPDQTLPETRSKTWVSDKVWLSPLRCPTSQPTVWSQTCLFNLDMYGFCSWVWSGHKQSLRVRVVEFGNDTTRPTISFLYLVYLLTY